MARADRAFAVLLTVVVVLAGAIAVPLVLTLSPGFADRIVRGSAETLVLCGGVISTVHAELPPFGLAGLGLMTAAVAPASFRAVQRLRRTRAGARRVAADTPARLRDAAARVGVADRVRCIADDARYAYCAGAIHRRIYVSMGAVRALRPRELEAVLWHEAHHLRRCDPLRVLVARGLAALFVAVPIVGELAVRLEIAMELDADSAALRAQGGADGLAGALLALGRDDPPPGGRSASAWSASGARIDQLTGATAGRLGPVISRRAIAGTTLALLVALVIAVGQAARAHLLPLGFLPETGDPMVHLCPLPISGPLL